ncbi:type IIL restriction-modification enzyme MmeI [Candidatus Chloroploca mongolica]|nr:type IIL restriction-modification enzyme MmeI [Candidatus Chloroploca mongolica]
MAKLSLWLITLQKDRPFSFLDHALRAGDSLLGLAHIDQLLHWSLGKTSGPTTATFLTEPLRRALQRASALRRKIRETPVIDVRDAERKAGWLREAEEALGLVRLAADLLVAAALHPEKKRRAELSDEFQYRMSLAAEAWEAVRQGSAGAPKGDANREELAALRREADALLAGRQPFHWPLEFPEVFLSGLGSRVSGLEEEGMGYRVSGMKSDSDATQKHPTPNIPDTLSPIPDIPDIRSGGFAAIVGNPPFLGGTRISTTQGSSYLQYLQLTFSSFHGRADICALFFIRSYDLIKKQGDFGLIATNTISQGDTRETGLDYIVSNSGVIYNAIPSLSWPGGAAVAVSVIHVRRGTWKGNFEIGGSLVDTISSSLEIAKQKSKPEQLHANSGKSFNGSKLDGIGFVIEPDEARILKSKDQKNTEILRPYLNGEDVNSDPNQTSSRWVIAFGERTLTQAEGYPDCLNIVRERVYPYRQTHQEERTRRNWWQFQRLRPELYHKIEKSSRVLVIPRVSKYLTCSWSSGKVIYSDATIVIVTENDAIFALIQSTIHDVWTRIQGSTLETRMRYTPTDCFETFPFPTSLQNDLTQRRRGAEAQSGPDARSPLPESHHPDTPDPRPQTPDPRPQTLDPRPQTLETIGERYHTHRKKVMLDRQEGLTKTYNRFHSPSETSADIAELRRLHEAMDNAVAAAYGWEDLDLGHGFHETKQGLRYTISEAARRVVLDRLLALNHQRYKEEVEAGLHDRGSGAGGRGSGKGGRKKKGGSEPEGQGRLL